jgi:hypothetical protein
MQRKRSYLILIVGIFAVYALCALALNLFSWLVMARDGVFEAGLRFQQQHAHERKSNAAQTPAETLVSQLRVSEGDSAPEFSLRDTDGKETRLRDLLGQLPIVIEFGSFT